ncbi:MAG: EAL domain-containing protein [Candidatus Nanopelagicales bacterium]|nr:EAL domain-containing protein [Candidatus Nanopelagicales bacterium]MCF8536989.1 EAL domain-containing protein [Candidatus Nanopelagicales bacterium]MCF8556846.1 EAL domain-containing protein [Candidatus Nanopelagicales bacterium]
MADAVEHFAPPADGLTLELDEECRVQLVTGSPQQMLGWSIDELIGRPLSDILDVDAPGADCADLAIHLTSVQFRESEDHAGTRHGFVSVKRRDASTHMLMVEVTDEAPSTILLFDVDELLASHDRFQAVVASMLDPFILMAGVRDDADHLIDLTWIDASDSALAYNQTTREAIIGRRLLDLYPGQLEDGPLRLYFHTLMTGEPTVLDDYMYPNEVLGSERRYDIRATRAGHDLLALTFRDVTDAFRVRQSLEASEELYRLVTADVTDAVLLVTTTGEVTWATQSWTSLTGQDSHRDEATSLRTIVLPESQARLTDLLRHVTRSEEGRDFRLRIAAAHGETRWISVSVRPQVVTTPAHGDCVMVVRDITDEVNVTTVLEEQSGRDSVTGLFNGHSHTQRLADIMERPGRCADFAMISVGVDRLADIRDALGHAASDRILRVIAARILQASDQPDLMARMTGDEFSVVICSPQALIRAQLFADDIITGAAEPISVREADVQPSVTVGIFYDPQTRAASELLRRASLALKHARDAGTGTWHVETELAHSGPLNQFELENLIRGALDNGRLECWFQPVVRLDTRELAGYEALTRIVDGSNTAPPPSVFVPAAEHSRLITEIDRHSISETIRRLQTSPVDWISVNVSAASLASPAFAEWLIDQVDTHQELASRLHLELTETTLLAMSESLVNVMRATVESGASWFADDFGTGFSSIAHLAELPIQGIKLDTSLTSKIDHSARVRKLTRGVAMLAQGLDFMTVAEGVETEEQADILHSMGWEFGQGYLFGRPQPMP